MQHSIHKNHPQDAYGTVPPSLTAAQRARIIPIDLDRPPPFVKVGDYKLGHEIANLPTPETSHWIVRHDWGAAAGIFNRGLRPATAAWQPQYQVALLQNEGGTIYRVPALEQREELRLQLQSDLSDLFLDNAIKLCSRVLKHSGLPTASLIMRFEHPGLTGAAQSDFHVDAPDGFRQFFVLEHMSLNIADEAEAMRTGLSFRQARDHVTAGMIYPAQLIDAGVSVYNTKPGVPIAMRSLPLRNLGPLSWHSGYEMPKGSKVMRPIFSADFSRTALRL